MTRIYDSSHLTKRRAEKAIAASFLANPYSPSTIPRHGIGMYDASVMNAVKTGNMPEITRFPTSITISPGYQDISYQATGNYIAASSLLTPGTVSGITFIVGSIIVSWIAPVVGTGPFTYRVTSYLNDIAVETITTTNISYKFDNLQITIIILYFNSFVKRGSLSSISLYISSYIFLCLC